MDEISSILIFGFIAILSTGFKIRLLISDKNIRISVDVEPIKPETIKALLVWNR